LRGGGGGWGLMGWGRRMRVRGWMLMGRCEALAVAWEL